MKIAAKGLAILLLAAGFFNAPASSAADFPEEHLLYRDQADLLQHVRWWRNGFLGPDRWNDPKVVPRAVKAAGSPAAMAVGPEQRVVELGTAVATH